MTEYVFSTQKNAVLKSERGISFEEIIFLIESGAMRHVRNHPNQQKYPKQKMYIVEINGYAYVVPFLDEDGVIRLKTAYPSRKATRQHVKRRNEP